MGVLEIKNNGVTCDNIDILLEDSWDISSDEKSIIIGSTFFRIVKMEATEMQLEENIAEKPVFVFRR